MYWGESRVKNQAVLFQKLPEETRNALFKEYHRGKTSQRTYIHTSTFSKVIEEARDFADKWKVSLDKVQLEHQYTEDYGSYSSEMYFEVDGLETDEQYHSRLWETHENNRMQSEHELREWERLKAKFNK